MVLTKSELIASLQNAVRILQTLAAIAAQTDAYATLLADVSNADFRAEVNGFDGNKTSRGALTSTWCSAGARPTARSCSCPSRPAAARS
jgi:hypothetical protein